jgi:hypothetical protein
MQMTVLGVFRKLLQTVKMTQFIKNNCFYFRKLNKVNLPDIQGLFIDTKTPRIRETEAIPPMNLNFPSLRGQLTLTPNAPRTIPAGSTLNQVVNGTGINMASATNNPRFNDFNQFIFGSGSTNLTTLVGSSTGVNQFGLGNYNTNTTTLMNSPFSRVNQVQTGNYNTNFIRTAGSPGSIYNQVGIGANNTNVFVA